MTVARRLEGKVCVITGAASGIGAASARAFAAEGARVVGVDLATSPDAELAIEADVTDERQVAALYRRVRDELGRVDVLFNNAGINPAEDGGVTDTFAPSSSAASTASSTSSKPVAVR